MSALGLRVFDETVQLSHIWLNDLLDKTGWSDKQRAYRLLRATLHATRDRLPVNEAADLAAQLPLLLRGVFYEGWRPAQTPTHIRSKQEFLDRVGVAFDRDPLDDAEAAVSAVFELLEEKISPGEMSDVRQSMPKSIRALFAD